MITASSEVEDDLIRLDGGVHCGTAGQEIRWCGVFECNLGGSSTLSSLFEATTTRFSELDYILVEPQFHIRLVPCYHGSPVRACVTTRHHQVQCLNQTKDNHGSEDSRLSPARWRNSAAPCPRNSSGNKQQHQQPPMQIQRYSS